jgi:hypothetical protein
MINKCPLTVGTKAVTVTVPVAVPVIFSSEVSVLMLTALEATAKLVSCE